MGARKTEERGFHSFESTLFLEATYSMITGSGRRRQYTSDLLVSELGTESRVQNFGLNSVTQFYYL